MKKLLAFVLLLALVLPASAEIKLAKAHRVVNTAGYCMWNSIEMLGRYHKIKAINGLTKFYEDQNLRKDIVVGATVIGEPARGPNYEEVLEQLDVLRVSYRAQPWGERERNNRELIKFATRNDLGCAVVVNSWWLEPEEGWGNSPAPTHAIVLTNYNDEEVTFVNSNFAYDEYVAPMVWFDHNFTGWTVVLIPNK